MDILEWVLTLTAGIVTTVFSTVIVPYIVKYLNAKIQNENVQAVVTELGDTVSTAVGYTTQTMVNEYKSTGKWDGRTQREVLNVCVKEVINGLSERTKQIITNDELDLVNIVTRRIEAEVEKQKHIPNFEYKPSIVIDDNDKANWEQILEYIRS